MWFFLLGSTVYPIILKEVGSDLQLLFIYHSPSQNVFILIDREWLHINKIFQLSTGTQQVHAAYSAYS